MSFASDTKSELLNIKADEHCKLAELSALLRINGDIHIASTGLSVEFHTTNLGIARKVIRNVKELYNVDVEI